MNRVAYLTVLASLALLGCGTTEPHHGRWSPNAVPRNEDWHSPRASLLRFDANHDGVLTRTELITGLKAEFNLFDTSHKNCLSSDQARAINQLRVQQDASQASPLADWNQDGCIDFNEYSGTTLSLFDSLDTNGDGQLIATELNPSNRQPRENPTGEQGRGRHGRGNGGGGGDGDGR
jgi:hypothetical protein